MKDNLLFDVKNVHFSYVKKLYTQRMVLQLDHRDSRDFNSRFGKECDTQVINRYDSVEDIFR